MSLSRTSPSFIGSLFKRNVEGIKKYIVLVEPSYEFTNKITRNHIFRKNYVKITDKVLSKILKGLRYKRFKMPIFNI